MLAGGGQARGVGSLVVVRMSWSKLLGNPLTMVQRRSLPRDSGLQARDEEFDFGLEVGRETDSDGEKCEQYTHKYSTYRLHSMITSEFGLAAQGI